MRLLMGAVSEELRWGKVMRTQFNQDSIADLREENALLYEEVKVARKASEITAELVVEQFIKMEKLLQQLEGKVATEQQLQKSLSEKLQEAEIRKRNLAEARTAAEAANKAKSIFLANMSHELRTPLNAIIGYSEMLMEDVEDLEHEDSIPDLQRIRTAGKHLLHLINEILDLSKVETGKTELYLETFDVCQMLEETVNTVQPLVEKNANILKIFCSDNLDSMYADLTKVKQTLFNLINNACKFTQQGTITLEVIRETSSTTPQKNGDWFIFRIIDTGIGMTEEQLGKVFEYFSQADPSISRKFGGTGLGLTISRHFCTMMGGNITAESTYGRGATFTVRLPAEVSASKINHSVPD